MRLYKARVKNYRSVIDSGEFEVEKLKTIFVGPNEAGKTVILRALQQLNKPDDIAGFDALRDYPRSEYNDITSGKVEVNDVVVVEGIFTLDDGDIALIDQKLHGCKYKFYRKLDNTGAHELIDAPERTVYSALERDFARLLSHMDKQFALEDNQAEVQKPSDKFKQITATYKPYHLVSDNKAIDLETFLKDNLNYIDE
jgi:hypothetical protein